MLKNLKNKGITLIALVVTIIVLLILAGISITMLSGNNGLLKRATAAKTNTQNAGTKEQVQLQVLGNFEGTAKLNLAKLKSNLEETGATVIGDSFPITATISDKKYTIESNGNVQEVNENIVTIAELQENASTYFGYDIINYAETLPEDLQDTKWQLFYAGPLDGENEGRIYLISKEYVKNTVLPEKNKKKTIPGNTDYKAKFGNTGATDGIMPEYAEGSNLIMQSKLKKLNQKYFSYLAQNNLNSTNFNMRAVAYMMDTEAWSPFATSTKGYAEYAIGGPTVELLFTAYNKYINNSNAYQTQVINTNGYQVKSSDGSFTSSINDAISNSAVPYTANVFSSIKEAGYWIASPVDMNNEYYGIAYLMCVLSTNGSIYYATYSYSHMGFRPIILLNSNFQLEKVKDSNNNNAFKIVAK